MARDYTQVRVTRETAENLQRFLLNLSAASGKRLSLNDSISVSVTIAEDNFDKAVEIAKRGKADE